MKQYQHYMDRMEPSQALHQELLSMQNKRRRASFHWQAAACLAACCALVIGLAGYGLSRHGSAPGPVDNPDPQVYPTNPQTTTYQPTQSPVVTLQPSKAPLQTVDLSAVSFTVESASVFPADRGIEYPHLPYTIDGAPSAELLMGSHSEPLTRAQILQIFWGITPEETGETADLPGALCWQGYTVSGSAVYLADGSLYQVGITGTKEGHFFSLSLAAGHLPLACAVYPDASTVEINGVSVTTYAYQDEDFAELMVGSVGLRMDAAGDPVLPTALINWATQDSCPLTLDHILEPQFLPFWKTAEYASLAEVRGAEADFLPWIPADIPFADWTFTARMTWQEDMEHTLNLRWSKGYDDNVITISLPQPGADLPVPVDAGNPASYDRRLYDKPYSETVPEEYWDSVVNTPCFWAEDITLDILASRAVPKDTGGTWYRFQVLTQDGTLLSYSFSGITAEEVLDLVLQTAGR